jgi:PKHD-type hydroxylase
VHMLEQLEAVSKPARQREAVDEATDYDFICRPIAFPGVLDATECARIVELGERGAAVIAGLTHPVEGYRTGSTTLIPLGRGSEWLYRSVSDILVRVNRWYRFEIEALVDSLLYCVYPEGGNFGWHIDCGEAPTNTRKISLSVQLSDAGDYDGGGLEFAVHGELRGARRIGTAVSFPAFLHHRVEPVTRGIRRSLVAWAHGPVFR